MATGDNDNDIEGDGVTGSEVHNDGNDVTGDFNDDKDGATGNEGNNQ